MTDQTRLAFHYANIKHESIEKMSPAQKEQALHEFIDLLDITKKHIYNPDVSPQTRIFALATILERVQKTGTRKPNGDRVIEEVTQQVPTWIGDKDKEGSLVHRLGISRNGISNEIKAFKQAGLLSTFYRDTEGSFNQHLDLAIAPDLLTHTELLPTKGERPRRKPVTCKECGSFGLIRRVVCPDCGTVHSEAYVNQEEEEEYTEDTVYPSTPPDVMEEENDKTQQSLCTREVHSVIVMNNCTREVHSVLTDWLQKRIGAGQQIFSTGKPNYADKYVSFVGPLHIESYLNGDLENIYGSQLRQVDGKTFVWSADIDMRDQEVYSKLDEFIQRLASAGILAIAWLRSDGSAHLEIAFSDPVIPEEADTYILSIVPEFGALKERYPFTTSNPLSWPFYYRKGNTVFPCTARYMSDELHSLTVANDETTLQQLAILAQECVTPAQLIEAYIKAHPIEKPEPTTKPAPAQGGYLDKDLARQFIADFNAQRSWHDIAALAGGFVRGKFLAVWRGDRKPTVSVDASTDLAKDFGVNEASMDKYDVYCRIMAHESGIDWRMFKRRDLQERCAYRRSQQERRAS